MGHFRTWHLDPNPSHWDDLFRVLGADRDLKEVMTCPEYIRLQPRSILIEAQDVDPLGIMRR